MRLFGWFRKKAVVSEPVSVFAVFTPGSPAVLNFVPRIDQLSSLETALSTPGMQVIVYGDSGSGKSTLLKNELQNHYSSPIVTRCTAQSSYQSIVLQAFDALDHWITAEVSRGSVSGTNAELAAEVSGIKASVGYSESASESSKQVRLLPPQLTSQKLGELIGAAGQCWVIEDFHKVPDSEKVGVSQAMKVFSDLGGDYPSLRAVIVGATEAARDVVAYDPEMGKRVAEIYVPPMSDREIRSLVEHGGKLMNADFGLIVDGIVRNSIGSGSVAHQLALNALLVRKVKRRSEDTVVLEGADLQEAGKKYVVSSSATLRARFDKGLFRAQSTGFDNCRLILEALATAEVKGALHGDLLATIKTSVASYPSGNLTTYLKQLATEERGLLIRKNLDGRYSFTEPLLHTYARLTLLGGDFTDSSDIYLPDLQRVTIVVDGARMDFQMPRRAKANRTD